MGVHVETNPCVTVTCDRCDEPLLYGDEGGTCHFHDEREAREAAHDHDWFEADDGTLICLGCAEDAPFYEVACPKCGAQIEESCPPERVFCEERVAALAATVAATAQA